MYRVEFSADQQGPWHGKYRLVLSEQPTAAQATIASRVVSRFSGNPQPFRQAHRLRLVVSIFELVKQFPYR